jgi:hypothetical protein
LASRMSPAGNKGGGQVKAEATKRAITMATRVASNDDGAGDGGKSDGDRNKGAGRVTTRAMGAATIVAAAMAMRVAGKDAMANGSTMVMFFFRVGG